MECRKCPPVQQRVLLSFLTAALTTVVYMAQSTYGVALVAMVNVTDSSSQPVNHSFEIFARKAGTNGTPISVNAPVYSWSRQMQGYILSAFYWGCVPFQVLGGNLAQRYGGKWIVAAGVLGMVVFDLIKPLSARGGPYVMIALFLIHGMVSSVIWPSIYAIYGRWIPPKEMSRMSALADVGSTFGQFIGLVISGPICASEILGGWPVVFYVNGASNLVMLIVWCLLVSSSPEDHPYISAQELQYIQESLQSKQEEVNKKEIPWRRILLSRFFVLTIGSFGFGSVSCMSSTMLPQYFNDVLHLSIDYDSLLISISSLVKPIALLACAQAFDLVIGHELVQRTFLRKLYVAVGSFFIASTFLSISIAHLSTWTVVALFTIGLGVWQMASLTYCVIPLDLSPEYAGTLAGILSVFRVLGAVIMPIVIDNMTTQRTRGEWNRVFLVCFAIVCTTHLVFILFGTAERQYQWTETHDKDSNQCTTDDQEHLA